MVLGLTFCHILQDVVLARVLDDAIVANLNSVIHANNAIVSCLWNVNPLTYMPLKACIPYFSLTDVYLLQVVSLLKDDSTFIQELFARLRSPSTSMESKKNLVFPAFRRHLLFCFIPQLFFILEDVYKSYFSEHLIGIIFFSPYVEMIFM